MGEAYYEVKEKIQATKGTQVRGITICDPCTKFLLLLLLFSCSYTEHQHSQFNSSMHKYRFQCYQLLQSRNRVTKHCINSYYAEGSCNTKISVQRLLHKRYKTFRWVTYWTMDALFTFFFIWWKSPHQTKDTLKKDLNINDTTGHSVLRVIWSWTHILIATKMIW